MADDADRQNRIAAFLKEEARRIAAELALQHPELADTYLDRAEQYQPIIPRHD